MFWWIIGIIVVSYIVFCIFCSFVKPEKGLIKNNIKIYLLARSKGMFHEEAVLYVIGSRYAISNSNRCKVLENFINKINNDDDELEQLKKLVFTIYNFEVIGGEPKYTNSLLSDIPNKIMLDEIEGTIKNINTKYNIPLNVSAKLENITEATQILSGSLKG
jgi:hypothetical protein